MRREGLPLHVASIALVGRPIKVKAWRISACRSLGFLCAHKFVRAPGWLIGCWEDTSLELLHQWAGLEESFAKWFGSSVLHQELLERERRPAPISDEGLRSPELEHQAPGVQRVKVTGTHSYKGLNMQLTVQLTVICFDVHTDPMALRWLLLPTFCQVKREAM